MFMFDDKNSLFDFVVQPEWKCKYLIVCVFDKTGLSYEPGAVLKEGRCASRCGGQIRSAV